jgi:hypothetical protein
MSLTPSYNISDIRLSISDREYRKWLDLYDSSKVSDIQEDPDEWTATVHGTQLYSVSVGARHWDQGSCSCYIGQRDEVCKHLIALAVAVTKAYGKWEDTYEGMELDTAYCSGDIREMTSDESTTIKSSIREAMKLIRSYNGPSSIWFTYQNHLQQWSRMLLLVLSDLPICHASVDICLSTLSKLDKKLCEWWVDDSDGVVWDVMGQMIDILCLMSDIHPPIIPYILKKIPEWQTWDWDRSYREQYWESQQ